MDQITGLLPETISVFSNNRDFRAVASNDKARDESLFDYFRAYARENFCDGLIAGMGTEQILDAFKSASPAGRWLDLGCGPTSFLWTCAMEGLRGVTAVDVVPEALMVLHDLRSEFWMPQCYRDALNRYGKPSGHLHAMYRLPFEALAFDFVQEWPLDLSNFRFETISAIGSFGLSSDPGVFRKCVENCLPYLEHRGALIGANWTRTDRALKERDYNTRFLTRDFIASTLLETGFEVTAIERVPIEGSDLYAAVMVWVGRRNAERRR